jgi:hypothetical protein
MKTIEEECSLEGVDVSLSVFSLKINGFDL